MVKKGMSPLKAKTLRDKRGIENSKLAELRIKKGLSQSDLANKAAIPISTIRCYEQGTRPIDNARLKVLCNLCVVLDCKVDDILENHDLIERYKLVK